MDATLGTTITSVASTVGVILVTYIAYRQAQLGKVMADVKKQSDGLTSALVASTDRAAHAEGKAEGKAESAGIAPLLVPPQPDA